MVWNLSLEEVEPNTGRVLTKTRTRVKDLGSAKCCFNGSHVLYSKLRPYLNKVVVPDEAGVGTSELIPMRPDASRLDREFLAWYLRSPCFLEFSANHTRGANLPRVAMGDLWKHRVPVPSLSDQRRVVARIRDLMERVDEVSRLRSENAPKAGVLLAALLREQFEGLEAKHRKSALENVTLESRYGTSERCDAGFAGTPVLRIPNVADRRCNVEGLKYLARRLDEGDGLILRSGDLLVVRTNGSPDLVGRCAVVPELREAYGYASYLIRFRLDAKKARPKYVSYFLSSTRGRDQIARLRRTSAGQYNINSESLRSILVPLPPVDVQDAMIEGMDRIDLSVRDLQARLAIERSRETLLPAAILRRAFAGEL
jgi:type I restriction enzyme S subunit